jgi:hypothetical protein
MGSGEVAGRLALPMANRCEGRSEADAAGADFGSLVVNVAAGAVAAGVGIGEGAAGTSVGPLAGRLNGGSGVICAVGASPEVTGLLLAAAGRSGTIAEGVDDPGANDCELRGSENPVPASGTWGRTGPEGAGGLGAAPSADGGVETVAGAAGSGAAGFVSTGT